jgi:hypothetical protein
MSTLKELREAWKTECDSKSETKAIVETLKEEDFDPVGEAAVNMIARWHKLAQRRSELFQKYPDCKSIPKAVQRYHTLLLREVVTQSLPDIGVLYGAPAKLVASGLNIEFSRFFIANVLEPKSTETGTHVLKGNLVREAKPILAESLGHYGLGYDAIEWALSGMDEAPEETEVRVLPADFPIIHKYFDPWYLGDSVTRYWDRDLEDPGFGQWGSGGGGGGGHGGGIVIDPPMIVTKGVGLLFGDLLGIISTALRISVIWEDNNGVVDDEGYIVMGAGSLVKGGYPTGSDWLDYVTDVGNCVGSIASGGLTSVGACGQALRSGWSLGTKLGDWIYDKTHSSETDTDQNGSGGSNSFVDP